MVGALRIGKARDKFAGTRHTWQLPSLSRKRDFIPKVTGMQAPAVPRHDWKPRRLEVPSDTPHLSPFGSCKCKWASLLNALAFRERQGILRQAGKMDVKTALENQMRPRCDGEKTEVERERKREGGTEGRYLIPLPPQEEGWGAYHGDLKLMKETK